MDTGIVRDGWLLKSPPENNFCRAVNLSSLRPKWRKRWFVLKHSGQLPGQYVLEYFTDSSCKKRKGRIDLDQCERVDSGLTFSNRKQNNRFMFDIRTPKRIYYLVAESEVDMTKWVDCICSVCGLKIEVDEDEEAGHAVEPLATASTQLALTTAPPSLVATPAPPVTNLTSVTSESSPYIPISECITGKPIHNGFLSGTRSSDNLNLVILPMRRCSTDTKVLLNSNDEFYDHPRSHFMTVSRESHSNGNDLYRIPPPSHAPSKSEDRSDWDNAFIDDDSYPLCPPRVNWNTFPHNITAEKQIDSSTYDVPVKSSEALSQSFMVMDPKNTEFKIKGHKYVRCEKVKSKDDHSAEATSPASPDSAFGAPPRPPKPAFLDKRKYENFDPNSNPNASVSGLYDVPPPTTSVIAFKDVPNSKHMDGEVFLFSKEETRSAGDLSPSTKVPLVPPGMPPKENSLDDMYDFPRARGDSTRNTLPSKSSLKARKARQHAYSNAPPGLFNAKDNIMNYEYRPSLMSSDNSPDLADSDLSIEADSPLSPPGSSGCLYANVPASPSTSEDLVLPPPHINRELKPKKKSLIGSESGLGPFNLAPPPAPKMGSSKHSATIAKQRAAPSPTPVNGLNSAPPAIPYRPVQSDKSDEELSSCGGGSRRNSTNEEPTKHWVPPAPRKVGGEIQYLELDMDSDSGLQIPRSPDRSSTSTVYKTVDFMKTKVFNEIREVVEEAYRKSQ